MFCHLALWTLGWFQTLIQFELSGLHFTGYRLECVLILLLTFKSFIKGALFFTYLMRNRRSEFQPLIQDLNVFFASYIPRLKWLNPKTCNIVFQKQKLEIKTAILKLLICLNIINQILCSVTGKKQNTLLCRDKLWTFLWIITDFMHSIMYSLIEAYPIIAAVPFQKN